MVMFKEDDEKYKKPPGKVRIAIRRLFKVSLVFGLLIFVSLMVLSALGGQHEALKLGVEDYLSQSTQSRAEIGTFDNLTFFPNMKFDAGNITLTRGDGRVARLERIEFSMPFWDMIFSRSRMEYFTISGLDLAPRFVTEKQLVLDHAALAPDMGNGLAGLLVEGRYGDDPLAAQIEMDVIALSPERRLYKMAEDRALSAHIGPLYIEGNLLQTRRGFELNLKTLGLPDREISVSGEVGFSSFWQRFDMRGWLNVGGSTLDFALRTRDKKTSGHVSFDPLETTDIPLMIALHEAYRAYVPQRPGGTDNIDFDPESGAAIDLAIKELRRAGTVIGNIAAPLNLEARTMTIGPFSGQIAGGDLKGRIRLSGQPPAAQLDARLALSGWDYGQIQYAFYRRDDVTGSGALHIALRGAGRSLADIAADLHGDVALLGESGTMPLAALNIWEGGLMSAMVPQRDPESTAEVKCLLGDFKVEGGIARPAPLLLDMQDMMVQGQGEIDLRALTLDLALMPYLKVAGGADNAAFNLQLQGQLAAPVITEAGPAGGAIPAPEIPAFRAFSLSDLGLTAAHPCYHFLAGDAR